MVQKHALRTVGCVLCCVVMMLAFTRDAEAQWQRRAPLSASAAVRLIAIKPSSISVSVHEVPLAFDFQPNISNPALPVPVTTSWNVNPLEVRGVEVVAYFADPEHALTSPEAAFIPARDVLGRVDGSAYRAFDQTNRFGPAASSLRLLSEPISSANRLATRNQLLEIRLNETRLQNQPSARYSGVLQIEARYY